MGGRGTVVHEMRPPGVRLFLRFRKTVESVILLGVISMLSILSPATGQNEDACRQKIYRDQLHQDHQKIYRLATLKPFPKPAGYQHTDSSTAYPWTSPDSPPTHITTNIKKCGTGIIFVRSFETINPKKSPDNAPTSTRTSSPTTPAFRNRFSEREPPYGNRR